MSAAIKTADSLQPSTLMSAAARALLLGDYALITYETARLNQHFQQTPSSNILNGLSQKWVKSRNFAVASALTPNIDKHLWVRSFMLWHRACVGLSDCNYNYNLENKEKPRDTQVWFRCMKIINHLLHPHCFHLH